MIKRIIKDKELSRFIKDKCSENEVSIEISPLIIREDYVILKPDDYYNSLNIENRPPSVDCLIIQKCKNNSFKLTLVELKSIKTSKNFEIDNLTDKFKNTLDDFISKKFKNLLFVDFKSVELHFISNIEIHKRDIGLKLDTLITKKFKYNNKSYLIQPKMPSPLLKPCY